MYATLSPLVSYQYLLHPFDGTYQDWTQYFQQVYTAHPYNLSDPMQQHAPNGNYASDTHPSDIIVGELSAFSNGTQPDGTPISLRIQSSSTIKADSIFTFGHGPGGEELGSGVAFEYAPSYDEWLIVSPTFGDLADRLAQAATDNLIGHSKCQVLGPCSSPAVEGSQCSSTSGARGYCFVDYQGGLLCGRTADWWSYGAQYSTDTAYHVDVRETVPAAIACARFARATTDLSQPWQPRLLVGGCMVSDDPYHTGWEEVHLPAACSFPMDLGETAAGTGARDPSLIGCMDKGAHNYKPAARQPATAATDGRCLYNNRGCTNSLAINYNSEANIDDGSCIVETCGCSIGGGGTPYFGIASDTPKYESLYVGVPTRLALGGGLNAYPSYQAVSNYVAGATVLGGPMCPDHPTMGSACTFVVEGCMDPTAVNYNPDANTNTNTWCIAPVEGCMMPTYDIGCDTSRHPGATCHGAPEKVIGRYGLSSNFNAAATVNVPASCTFEVLGCTETTALNYDPRATVNFKCYTAKTGCLHPLALNFNCSTVGTSPCTDSVVVHSRSACTFYVPVINTRGVGATEMSWTLTTSGDAYRLGMDGMKDGVRNLTAAQISDYDASQIEVTCVAGSAIWTVTVPNLAPYQYSELKLWSEQALATTATAQAYLEAAGAYDYIVLDISVSETYDIAFPPPSAPPEEELGLILGIVAGAIVGVLVVAAGVYFFTKGAPKMQGPLPVAPSPT